MPASPKARGVQKAPAAKPGAKGQHDENALIATAVAAIGGAVNYAMANPEQVADLFGRLVSWVPGRGAGVKEQLADLTDHVEDQDQAIAFLLSECESLQGDVLGLQETNRLQRIWLIVAGVAAVVALVLALFH